MLTYDLIVIGFGKAGKTLAAKMAAQGKKVALIERSNFFSLSRHFGCQCFTGFPKADDN